MKLTKTQAKQYVEVYGNLLQDHGVISLIKNVELRDVISYNFFINTQKCSIEVSCEGIKNLATVLSSMWFAYEKARTDLGFDSI